MSSEAGGRGSCLTLAFALALSTGALGQKAPKIEDNSFLIEEAYNQEPGVVQHIFTFARRRGTAEWTSSLTQEWPVTGQRHQLSYNLYLHRVATSTGATTGFGDLKLNYRHQALGGEGSPVFLAPRASLTVPTGRVEAGRGSGAFGLELFLPASIAVLQHLTLHLNAGAAWVPAARSHGDPGVAARSFLLGGSAVWALASTFDLLVEGLWEDAREVVAVRQTVRSRSATLNPGIRWAHNFKSGLQIVPGLAYSFGVGPSEGDDALFLYLSFEHPFRRTGLSAAVAGSR